MSSPTSTTDMFITGLLLCGLATPTESTDPCPRDAETTPRSRPELTADERDELRHSLPLGSEALLADLELFDDRDRHSLRLSLDFGVGRRATLMGTTTTGWAQLLLDVPWERVLFPKPRAEPHDQAARRLPTTGGSTMPRTKVSALLPITTSVVMAGALSSSMADTRRAEPLSTPSTSGFAGPTSSRPRSALDPPSAPPVNARSAPAAIGPSAPITSSGTGPTPITARPNLTPAREPAVAGNTAPLASSAAAGAQPPTSGSGAATSSPGLSMWAPQAMADVGSATTVALVLAAWTTAGLDDDHLLDRMANRARWSALAPELRLRASRGADVGARLYLTGAELDKSASTDATQSFFEARLAFRLDRLVFADEEVSLARVRLERISLREKLAHRVGELIVRYRRAARACVDPTQTETEQAEALATASDALLMLDAYTGGAASTLLSPPRRP